MRREKRRPGRPAPELTIAQILGWADAFHERFGSWPMRRSGLIAGTPGETWTRVDVALQQGNRGLPGGSSLPRLLAEHRGVRNRKALPPFTVRQILAWADAHHERTGGWPTRESGSILEAPGETWAAVSSALASGIRGLPGGSSLAHLLATQRVHMLTPEELRVLGVRPRLTKAQVVRWADAYHQRTGAWPKVTSGAVSEMPGETWSSINTALKTGRRGLPGSSSLAAFLATHRGARYQRTLPRLTERLILAWADAYVRRTGKWPNQFSGPIPEMPGETWAAVHSNLGNGRRGLPGGSSLPRLLHAYRGVSNPAALPPLTVADILRWADAYHERTQQWPRRSSGLVAGVPDQTWLAVDAALSRGIRGLPGGSSLAQLLAERRGVRNRAALPRLTAKQIRRWAVAHHRRTGSWPNLASGAIAEAPGENWSAVDNALRRGHRGLPGGSSLCRLLQRTRGHAD